MTKDEKWYKIKVLKEFVNLEERNEMKYGACLEHWAGNRRISIDADAMRCLIRHYKRRKVI